MVEIILLLQSLMGIEIKNKQKNLQVYVSNRTQAETIVTVNSVARITFKILVSHH